LERKARKNGAAAAAAPESDSDSDEEQLDGEELRKRSAKELMAKMKQVEAKLALSSRYVEKVNFDKEEGEFCEFELEVSSLYPCLSALD
jgi:DNA-directed RNA polymerase I subunit RPA1